MKVEFEELEGLRVRLKVEVDAETFLAKKKKLARAYAPHVSLKGFRPGKAPIEMVMRHIGPSLDGEVREDIIKTTFADALEEHSVRPSMDPELDLGEIGEDGAFTYTAEFEYMPTIDPKDYLGVEIVEPTLPEITDEDVEGGMERMRGAAATWETKEADSVAHENDMAICRLVVRDEESGEVLVEEDDRRLVVGLTDYPVADMGRELLGMKGGEKKTVTGSFSDDPSMGVIQNEEEGDGDAQRKVTVEVEVKEVMQKVLPELDDDFAAKYGGGVTLDEWRTKVREQLAAGREKSLKELREDAVVDAILAKNEIELGQATVDNLAKAAEDAAKARILPSMPKEERDKIDLGLPKEDTEAQARRNLSRQIILQAIADKEGVEVSEEDMDAKLSEMADELGMPLPKLKAGLAGEEGDRLKTRIRLEKTLDMLVRYAVTKAEDEAEADKADKADDPEPTPEATGDQKPEEKEPETSEETQP
ncbi:MAG: trigger factor [Deltaproteobacteria bacterium]|nr:trigger factor [Deltaproteobacteria bacterium]